MQSIKNKLHLNKNKNKEKKAHRFSRNVDTTPNVLVPAATTVNPTYGTDPVSVVATSTPTRASFERERMSDHSYSTGSSSMMMPQASYESFSSIPTAPPAPALWVPARNDMWDSYGLDSLQWQRGSGFFENYGYSSNTQWFSSAATAAPLVSKIQLPTQIIEKPMAVHEEIRREQIEEIQPVINIEKLQTEVHQVTQPLIDKEVKPVHLEKRLLDTQVLPEVHLPGLGMAMPTERSSVHVQNTAGLVVEKPALIRETDKLQVIEEIQPVLYKETVVPTVIQETKPVYQKVVEGASYSQETRSARDLTAGRPAAVGYVPDRNPAPAPVLERVSLPTQVIEKPMAIHEEIRKELVEEIQPVINVEKMSTEVHQLTQPLFDKEIKPVTFENRLLDTQVLPTVQLPGRGFAADQEMSTVHIQEAAAVVLEKPALVREVDKLQIIEEIQPVLYKETIVPTLIQETKPVYQKIIVGTVYSHEVLPVRDLSSMRLGMSELNLGKSPSSSRNNVSGMKTFDEPMIGRGSNVQSNLNGMSQYRY